MRGDLREKLAAVWGKHEKTGVTPVTGVTRGTSGGITHATENVTVVTKDFGYASRHQWLRRLRGLRLENSYSA